MPVKATDKVFSLRLPIDVYKILEEQAAKNKRSVNSEILLSIEKSISSIKSETDRNLQKKT